MSQGSTFKSTLSILVSNARFFISSSRIKGGNCCAAKSLPVVLLLASPALIAQTPARVTRPIEASDRSALANTVRHELKGATDQGRIGGSKQLTSIMLSFAKTAAQETALQKLLADQQNPAMPDYHAWLTPEQYGGRFGANPDDIAKVVEWLGGAGFSNVKIANGRNFVTFDGNVATAEAAFGVEIHNYMVRDEAHFANSTSVLIPAAFRTLIMGISGLHDFYPKPRHVQRIVAAAPEYNQGTTEHYLAAEDIQTIYDIKPLYNSGYTGSGVKLVIVGQAAISPNDVNISNYRKLNGLPAINLQTIPDTADGSPSTKTSDVDEAYLDIEVAGAVAKGSTIIYVYTANAFNAARYAINQNLGQVLSISFGGCETTFASSTLEDLFMQANTQGMTVIAASGDSGAAGCDDGTATSASKGLAVEYPASSAYVTGIGGTTLQETSGSFWGAADASGGSALKYIPEVTWNDTKMGSGKGCDFYLLLFTGIGCASGGGTSIDFPRPAWQVGKGISAGSPNNTKRLVPDLAFAASADHDGYLTCMPSYCVNGFFSSNKNLNIEGGTSAAAPLFAGLVALVDQRLSPLDPRQGNINPRIYALAASTPGVFNDVAVGTNRVPTSGTTSYIGFVAAPGYDLVTGWGSVDANQFVTAFASVPVITSWSVSPNTVPLGSGITISYTATDSSGAKLSRAELWRAPDANGKPGTWTEEGSSQSLNASGPVQVKLIGKPTAKGKYWYGSHLFDGAGNEAIEPNPTQVTVGNPIPSISEFNPTSLQAGSAPQELTVRGTGFVSTSTVTFNKKVHAAAYVSATSLGISLTALDLAKAGSYPVAVTNPGPGGGLRLRPSSLLLPQTRFRRLRDLLRPNLW